LNLIHSWYTTSRFEPITRIQKCSSICAPFGMSLLTIVFSIRLDMAFSIVGYVGPSGVSKPIGPTTPNGPTTSMGSATTSGSTPTCKNYKNTEKKSADKRELSLALKKFGFRKGKRKKNRNHYPPL
jgi:hypothetical protein